MTPMIPVEFEGGAIQVDAKIVGDGLSIPPEQILERVREGRVTSLCEKGMDEDAGRFRLSFFSEHCRLTFIVDESGKIIRRSTIDFGELPLPASARKPRG